MKKIFITLSILSLILIAVIAYSSNVFAQETKHGVDRDDRHNLAKGFNANTELRKSQCTGAKGEPLVNVVEKVRNDADSGFAGNYWAFDYYNRRIQVWPTGENQYCAIVTYDGQFYAVPGQVGPGNNPAGAKIDSPVNGDMSGGYRATFNGTFAPTGEWQTRGNVGTVDYKCNITGSDCQYVNWLSKYFPGYTNFAQPWWGWIYRGGNNGTWINASDVTQPNSGNIL